MPASWLVPLKAEDIPEFYKPVRSSVTRKKKHEKGENTMKKLISRRNFLKVCALAGSAAALSACGGKSTGSSSLPGPANPPAAAILLPQMWT